MTAPLTNDEALTALRIALAEISRKDAELVELRARADLRDNVAREALSRLDTKVEDLAGLDRLREAAMQLCITSHELAVRAETIEDRSQARTMRLLQDARRVEACVDRVMSLCGAAP